MDKLEYVLTLAEERNLTRAAARLFISQPTLTNYINRLERDLGIKLFDRSVQPIQVTEAGVIYIEDMKKIQTRELALRSKLTSLKQKSSTFVIGVPPVRCSLMIPKALELFMRLYPDVTVRLDNRLEADLEKDLAAGRVDMAIGALTTAYPGIRYKVLKTEKIYLLVPRSWSCVASLSPKEGTLEHPFLLDGGCINGKCLLMPRIGGGQYQMAMQMLERHNIVPQNMIHSGDMNTLYQLAGLGVGCLFVTPIPFMSTYPQYTEHLAFCVLQQEDLYQKSYLGYPEESPNLQMTEDFCRLLEQSNRF